MTHENGTVKSGMSGGEFDPEPMMRFWQHGALRLMRANERMLHGYLAMATREAALMQRLMHYNVDRFQHNCARFQQFSSQGKAAKPAANGESGLHELEQIFSELRELSEELWQTFADTSKLLIEDTLTEAREIHPAERRENNRILEKMGPGRAGGG